MNLRLALISALVGSSVTGLAQSAHNATATISGNSLPSTPTGSTCTASANLSLSSFPAQGGTGLARIATSSNNCVWDAHSTVPWLQLASSDSTGQGSGGVPFIVASNPGSVSRTGQILIGDQTLTVTQSAGPVGSINGYTITTFAGGSSSSQTGDGGPATAAYLYAPGSLAFDPASNSLYIAEGGGSRVRVVTPDGLINTFAGGGNATPDNVPATSAQLVGPISIAVDGSSSVYLSYAATRILKISQGIVRTFAGAANPGFAGDNGVAVNAQFDNPSSLIVDSSQNLYFSDTNNKRVRKISAGIVTTVAGGGASGLGDNGPATSATLALPYGLAFDAPGNLYIADSVNGRIRRISQGAITTVAGGGEGGDGPATSAHLAFPLWMASDPLGSVFFTEPLTLRKLSTDGRLSTVPGLPTSIFGGVAADLSGNVYLSDTVFNLVRKLTPAPSFCTYSVSTPPPQLVAGGSFSISVSTAAGCIWSAVSDLPWVAITSGSSGSGSGAVQFSMAPYTGIVRGGKVAIAGQFVTVTQWIGPPMLSVNPTAIYMATNKAAPAPSPQTVNVTFTGAPATWFPLPSSGHISVSPPGGTGNGSFQVHTDGVTGNGSITVFVPGFASQEIKVYVYAADLAPPFGSFDTPVNNTSGIAGAIAVTGWALDNVEISKVDIWRERVGAEPVSSNGLVYIGDAVFVENARPDVQAAYATTPWNYRAGWGYLLLTNFLPAVSGPSGNGAYRLHGIAHNTAGMSTDLGAHTIFVDNAHASKPFGTIDTPSPGGTASGTQFVNFGWALTPSPVCISADASSMYVTVDGVSIGHPVYNQYRSDVANAFPGLCNSNGAVGYFILDTTTLTNGTHTIGWLVYDNLNRGEGIGSRFFNVLNVGAGVAALDESFPSRSSAALDSLSQDPRGAYRIEVEELDRIEIDLGAASAEQLPIGSTLRAGVFYWHLGPGFLGEYPLTFRRADGSELNVRVAVSPKSFSGALQKSRN